MLRPGPRDRSRAARRRRRTTWQHPCTRRDSRRHRLSNRLGEQPGSLDDARSGLDERVLVLDRDHIVVARSLELLRKAAPPLDGSSASDGGVAPGVPVEHAVEPDTLAVEDSVLPVREPDPAGETANGCERIDRLPEEMARIEVDRQVRADSEQPFDRRDVVRGGSGLELEAETECR